MDIKEAIEHAKRERIGTGGCAADHAQLAEWLEELVRARDLIEALHAVIARQRAEVDRYRMAYCQRNVIVDIDRGQLAAIRRGLP